MPEEEAAADEMDEIRDCALIVYQEGAPQKLLFNFLNMLLSYQYGLLVETADDLIKGGRALRKRNRNTRCVFVIQDRPINIENAIPLLTQQGETPLFLLFPAALVETQREACTDLDNVFLCAWEATFGNRTFTLARLVQIAFEENGISGLLDDLGKEDEVNRQLDARLQNIDTLPTLPAIVLRLMQLLNRPKTSLKDLEKVLSSDPAMTLKIMQVVNSPAFAGASGEREWSLKEALARLGMKQVATVAQQVALVNCFVKPKESDFDLHRFWLHSMGCAVIAEQLYTQRIIRTPSKIRAEDYWIGALLHDCGKLVLGFFYPDWFERIVGQQKDGKYSFREAETQLSEAINHERIGQILMLKAQAGLEVVESVSQHHEPGEFPGSLTCLVHMADNFSKELGLGYSLEEKIVYSPEVLRTLKLEEEDIPELREKLRGTIVEEINKQVEQYLE